MNNHKKEYNMLNSLIEQAIKRAADARTSEIKKEQEEARAEAKMEEKFKSNQIEYLQGLLPNTIWNELGIDLTKLTFQYDTMFDDPRMNLAALTKQGRGTSFQYTAEGQFTLSLQGHKYKAGATLVASYLTWHLDPDNLGTLKFVKIVIEDSEIKLYRPQDDSKWSELNLIALSEGLRRFVEFASIKRASEYEDKKQMVRRSLDDEDLSSKKCSAVIEKLEISTWPEKDVKDLLKRAKVRLESIKAREADAQHDQQLLDKVWEMAKAHVAEWDAYGHACGEWAERTIEQYWHPFTLFALRFAVSGNNTETVYCLSDKPDEDGYLKVVTPDGTIIEKRFCRPISWQRETFDVRPDSESKSFCHYRIPAPWGLFTVSLPPADVHNREIDPIAIKESQPSLPKSWWVRIEQVCDLFINKEWAERIHTIDPKDIASAEVSTWFRGLA